ncbi:hypothetical protein FAIPA1_30010 [Frankia sp. AiPs1]
MTGAAALRIRPTATAPSGAWGSGPATWSTGREARTPMGPARPRPTGRRFSALLHRRGRWHQWAGAA